MVSAIYLSPAFKAMGLESFGKSRDLASYLGKPQLWGSLRRSWMLLPRSFLPFEHFLLKTASTAVFWSLVSHIFSMSAAMRRDARPFMQPYMEALRERMIMFGTDELDKLRAAMDNDFDDVTDPTTAFPEVPARHQITSVTLSDEGLLGTSLAGAEIFEIPKSQLPETVTAATLIELAAGAMGVMPNSLTLWEGMSCSNCCVGYGFGTPNRA